MRLRSCCVLVVLVLAFAVGRASAQCGTPWTASDATTGDAFGVAVAVEGDLAIVGASHAAVSGPNSGAAYVLERLGGTWLETARLTASDGGPWDWFGRAVAFSDQTIVIGAPRSRLAGPDSGAAYVFVRDGDAWVALGELRPDGGAAGDRFGAAVAVLGDLALVGAPRAGTTHAGAVYVFARQDDGWMQVARLTASDSTPVAWFGAGVALALDGSDAIAVVGAPRADGSLPSSGAAYVFRGTTEVWVEEAILRPADGASGDWFGAAVSAGAGTIAVGAWGADDAGSESGAAYAYVAEEGTWGLQQRLTAPAAAAGERFGFAVSVRGERILVGAPGGPTGGAAHVYQRTGGAWNVEYTLLAPEGSAGDDYGAAAALTDDAALVGAPGTAASGRTWLVAGLNDCNANGQIDACDVADGSSFDCNANGVPDECDLASGSSGDCNQNNVPDECDIASGDSADVDGNDVPDECESCIGFERARFDSAAAEAEGYGAAVAQAGAWLLVGAPGAGEGGMASGAAYLFELVADAWVPVPWALPEGLAAEDAYGAAVALRGEVAVVGAVGDDERGMDAGAAYVYRLLDGVWTLEQKLLPDEASEGAAFGSQVAVRADVLAIGAPQDSTRADQAGAIYVFHRQDGDWVRARKLLADGGAAGDRLGASLNVGLQYIVAGAPGSDQVATDAGAVILFNQLEADWVQDAVVLAGDAAEGDAFGSAVAILSGTLLVGAPGVDGADEDAGAAYLFQYEDDAWTALQKLTPPGAAADWRLGSAVHVQGGAVVAGAPGYEMGGAAVGAVLLFRSDEGVWALDAVLAAEAGAEGDAFGAALDGELAQGLLAVGAPGATAGRGAAFEFRGVADCDTTGRTDFCELADGTAADCNGNGFPDACDVTGGMAGDCDGNYVPDECQEDRDNDGWIDPCDQCPDDPDKHEVGSCGCGAPETDLDGDGVSDCVDLCLDTPDGIEVDVDGCPAHDCNQNLIDDGMDIAAGTSADCDSNGRPDECQRDRDDDGIIDRCDNCPEFRNPDQADGDGNGVGDECEPGAEGPQLPDGFEKPVVPDPAEEDDAPDSPGTNGPAEPDDQELVSQPIPENLLPVGCGAGACGAGVVGWLPLTLLGLAGLRRTRGTPGRCPIIRRSNEHGRAVRGSQTTERTGR